mgnify:CR=1 FL=1
MVEILKYNDDDLKDNEIDQVVTRVKAFIVSSKNNILIGKDEEGYQLLGGYVGENEDYVTALATAISPQCLPIHLNTTALLLAYIVCLMSVTVFTACCTAVSKPSALSV